jgi:hypothetical protein
MRRLAFALAGIASLASLPNLIGCQDGPAQTFSPAPEGAGDKWNNGNTPPVVPDAGQGFGSSYPTTGQTTICNTDLKRERWAWMLNQPIVPPRRYAGIDMAKDDLWHGLTIEDAESSPPGTPPDPNSATGGLCQSVPFGFVGGCPSGFGNCNQNTWGNNNEVIFTWNLATHVVDQMELFLGYLGTLTMKSKDGKDTFVIRIGDVPKKNDQPYLIPWDGAPSAYGRAVTELFNAAIATFGPDAGIAPVSTSGTCKADADCAMQAGFPFCISGECVSNCASDGNCLVNPNSGGVTLMGFRPLVIYFIGTAGVPQPALSTPVNVYNFYSKFEPYGYLPQVMKLDPEGPVASGNPRGARDPNLVCTQRVGISFGEYKTNCIQVHGPVGMPDMFDVVNLNKIENGLTHDQEHWTANVVGVNQNFTSEKVAQSPDSVVLDTDVPQDGDFAQDFFFDLRARGHVRNDYNAKDKIDLRGTAMIYIEWARLMLNDINMQMKAAGKIPADQPPKVLGDPDCTGFDNNGNPIFKPGCSGIEGMMIPAWPGRTQFLKDASCARGGQCLDAGANFDYNVAFYGVSVLKPGVSTSAFCVDPGNFTDCYQDGSLSAFGNALNWVTRLLGKGNINNLPTELRDRRYYFRHFATAYVKYLKAYSNFQPQANRDNLPCSTKVDAKCMSGGPGPTDVMNQNIDLESLFFDNNSQGGGNGFDKFEYIDRENIGKGQEGMGSAKYNFIPWDFEYGCDLIGGNQRYDNYFRRMDREEIAMYSAMLKDKRHTPGQENNVNITNLFGSPLLPGNWPSYACAVGAGGDPAMSGCPPPPLDSTNMKSCSAGACDFANPCHDTCGGDFCVMSPTHETGIVKVCGGACDFNKYPDTGCQKPNQTCVLSQLDGLTEACVDMMMDLNGPTALSPHPVLYYYEGAWSRTPFSMGHSPITIKEADKRPKLGVAKITIPNFADGPYTASPQVLPFGGKCPQGWMADATGQYCTAPLSQGNTPTTVANFTPLVPWLEVQPGVGFSFPIDGQHDQAVATGQLDFTGVLETYIVDYTPWIDGHKPSCANGDGCGPGFTCDAVSKKCFASDDTIQVLAIESADFLGEVFLCQDPKTQDILHVRQYDSALAVVDWLAAHPGGWDPINQVVMPSAQDACAIVVRYSPYNNYIDYITSKAYGVKLSINQGAGLGRVIDATLYDPSITQTP